MTNNKFLLLSFVAICMFTACDNDTNVNNTDYVPFSFADPSHEIGPDYFTFFFEENTLVTWNDEVSSDLYDIEWTILDLRNLVQDGWFIDSFAFAPYQDDIIVAFVTSNVDFGNSNVARIDGDTMTPIWVSESLGFNMGSPVIKNNAIYFSTIGSITKIDIETGELIWEHTDLYERETQDFNSFKKPMFSDGKVIFQGSNIFSQCPKRIEVDDTTGDILRIVETCLP